jgi:hypothetical protein
MPAVAQGGFMRMKSGLMVAALLLTVAAGSFARLTVVSAQSAPGVWNAAASADLTSALHKMHDAWNNGDIRALKQLVAGDDTLVTFELDPVSHRPIRLGSKKDLDAFVDAVANDQSGTNAEYRLENPVVNCKATNAMGICTEECTVHVTTPDGTRKVHRLWSTATAIKDGENWKWIQWHMSLAAPTQVFKNGKLVSDRQ